MFVVTCLVKDLLQVVRDGFRNVSEPAPLTMLVWTMVSRWILFAAPWLLLAGAAGTLYGLIGAWWGRSRARLAGAALAAPSSPSRVDLAGLQRLTPGPTGRLGLRGHRRSGGSRVGRHATKADGRQLTRFKVNVQETPNLLSSPQASTSE